MTIPPPTGVKVLYVLAYISAGLNALVMLLAVGFMLFGGKLLIAFLPSAQPEAEFGLAAIFGTMAVILAIGGAVGTALNFLIARGLSHGRNWARVLTIVISAIAVLFGLFGAVRGEIRDIVLVLLYSLVGGYLLLNQKVKEFFGQKLMPPAPLPPHQQTPNQVQ